MRSNLMTVWASLCLGLAVAAPAQALTGREVVERADSEQRAQDEITQATMVIVSPRGVKRERKLESRFKSGPSSNDKVLVRFLAPSDVKGTGLLTIEEGDSDTQWLFIPDLRRSKRIAGSNKAGRFMASDFSNFDMRTEDLQNHAYELVGEAEVEGRACHKVNAKPKDGETAENTGYSLRTIYIDKERFTVAKAEFFDRRGKPLKVLTHGGWHQVSGLWRPRSALMVNQQEGSRTIVTNNSRTINQGLSDREFTKRALER
ncbi:MAG: outer membrane lipoprotein-sorting protein [Planctomycetota bacterium]|jgi:outer membrane lipoprotein-sorting protein